MEAVWYEKTVEYKFVFMAKRLWGIDLLSPLAGNPEVIGDGIVSASNRYYIIEFKRDFESIPSEYEKYKDGIEGFKKTKITMTKSPHWEYHYIIHGYYTPSNQKFGIYVNKYFGVWEKSKKSIRNNFKGGMDITQLNQYATKFTACKNGDYDDSEGSSGGESGREIVIKTKILAINNTNNIATITTFEYIKKAQDALKKAAKYKEEASENQEREKVLEERRKLFEATKDIELKNNGGVKSKVNSKVENDKNTN
ncbi:hypothetical protein ACRPHS_04270 [Pantoea allii]|uniref:hypothetical protein n=1 Tax=Pantoea allii TaxID=574096 RepID=UPI001561751C|nr:hypothetical protein [Pantoea allii]NQS86964.1 hypothetical protein [Pantoea allii]